MNDQILFLLLSVINNKGNIKKLINEGYSYKQVSEFIDYAGDEGFLIYNDEKLILSEAGILKLAEIEKRFKITDKNKWIEPEEKSRIKNQLSKDFIYLPHQDELHF